MISLVFSSILRDPIILPSGFLLLACHILLYLILRSNLILNGPWRILPSFTAHQIIAFVASIYQTYLGFLYFNFSNGEWKILGGDNEIDYIVTGARFLAQLCAGRMLCWDIPVGLFSNGLGSMIIMLHHVGFFLVSSISLGIFSSDGMPLGCTSYGPFFFGCIELSTIPLVIVDVFHPKQKAWHAWLSSPTLKSINEFCRIAFAVLFLMMRGIIFPYVIGTGVIPDYWETSILHPKYAVPCRLMVGLAILFTILQSYWAILILQQILKMVGGKKKLET